MRTIFLSTVLLATVLWGPRVAIAGRISVIGLKGGVSVATLHGRMPTEDPFQNGWRVGAAGGVSVTLDLGSRIALQPA